MGLGTTSRFAPPATKPLATQPVSDAQTHQLLERVQEALRALSDAAPPEVGGREVSVVVPPDPRLDALARALADLHGLLLEQASRPAPPAPQVNPVVALPPGLLDALQALLDRPVETDGTVRLDDETIQALAKAMPKPPTVVGGSQTRRVEVIHNNSPISPATEATVDRIADAVEGTLVVNATGTLLQDIKRAVTDYETRLDYDTRTDNNPVYVGKNTQDVATNAATWTIQKLEYDSDNRLTRAQVKVGVWDDRATLF